MTYSRPSSRRFDVNYRPSRPNAPGDPQTQRINLGNNGEFKDYRNPNIAAANAERPYKELSAFLQEAVNVGAKVYEAYDNVQVQKQVGAALAQVDPGVLTAGPTDPKFQAVYNQLNPRAQFKFQQAAGRSMAAGAQLMFAREAAASPVLRSADYNDDPEALAKETAAIRQRVAEQYPLATLNPRIAAQVIPDVQVVEQQALVEAREARLIALGQKQNAELQRNLEGNLEELAAIVQVNNIEGSEDPYTNAGRIVGNWIQWVQTLPYTTSRGPSQVTALTSGLQTIQNVVTRARAEGRYDVADGILSAFYDARAGKPNLGTEGEEDIFGIAIADNGTTFGSAFDQLYTREREQLDRIASSAGANKIAADYALAYEATTDPFERDRLQQEFRVSLLSRMRETVNPTDVNSLQQALSWGQGMFNLADQPTTQQLQNMTIIEQELARNPDQTQEIWETRILPGVASGALSADDALKRLSGIAADRYGADRPEDIQRRRVESEETPLFDAAVSREFTRLLDVTQEQGPEAMAALGITADENTQPQVFSRQVRDAEAVFAAGVEAERGKQLRQLEEQFRKENNGRSPTRDEWRDLNRNAIDLAIEKIAPGPKPKKPDPGEQAAKDLEFVRRGLIQNGGRLTPEVIPPRILNQLPPELRNNRKRLEGLVLQMLDTTQDNGKKVSETLGLGNKPKEAVKKFLDKTEQDARRRRTEANRNNRQRGRRRDLSSAEPGQTQTLASALPPIEMQTLETTGTTLGAELLRIAGVPPALAEQYGQPGVTTDAVNPMVQGQGPAAQMAMATPQGQPQGQAPQPQAQQQARSQIERQQDQNAVKPVQRRPLERPESITFENSSNNQGGIDVWFKSKRIPAVLPGKVHDIGFEPGYGNYIVVRSVDPKTGKEVDVLYGHVGNARGMGIGVAIGQQLNVGDVIGQQGSTGNVRSADGTITSIDFLAPAPAGSGSQVKYERFDALRKEVADSLRAGEGVSGGVASAGPPPTVASPTTPAAAPPEIIRNTGNWKYLYEALARWRDYDPPTRSGGLPVMASTPPLPQVDPNLQSAAMSLRITTTHPIARAIGISEGTLDASGKPTKHYYGHSDPGDGKRNMGIFSYSPERSGSGVATPEQANELWLRTLNQQVPKVDIAIRNAGVPPETTGYQRLMYNALDLYTQAPAAVVERGGFLERIPEIVKRGTTVEAIAWARAESFRDPASGRLLTSFPSYNALLADQKRRAYSWEYKK